LIEHNGDVTPKNYECSLLKWIIKKQDRCLAEMMWLRTATVSRPLWKL